ncbi:MAG: hypothetical protein JJU31_06940 [Wenzhouxiangella sp.]|nr:hypothetical protein [Wenzhouxiangella sp.]
MLLAGLLVITAVRAERTTVASFDIGSGTTRLLVAEVDPCNAAQPRIYERQSRRMSYGADLLDHQSDRFSPALMAEASATMQELIERAQVYQPDRIVAVATQAFRSAANGEELLDEWRQRWDLDARILSQEEEARLAYRLVLSRLAEAPQQLIVWDIGAGSQQLVWREPGSARWGHVNSRIASVSFRNRALEWLNRPPGRYSPNPLSVDEAEQLAAVLGEWINPDDSAVIRHLVKKGAMVVGIGGVHGASLVNQLDLAPGNDITRDAIAAALASQIGRSDQEIGGDYADTDVVNLILVGTLMDHFGMQSYRVMRMDLTEAVLLDLMPGSSADPGCKPLPGAGPCRVPDQNTREPVAPCRN